MSASTKNPAPDPNTVPPPAPDPNTVPPPAPDPNTVPPPAPDPSDVLQPRENDPPVAPSFKRASLKGALKVYTAESLAAEETEFYFSGVNKEESGRVMRDGTQEIVYNMRLMSVDGEILGMTRIARLSIAEQLEKAGVVDADPETWFGPVKIEQAGRTYKMVPTD